MAFQEFYCDAAGTNGASNMNAGDKTTSPVTTTNGAYTQGAGAGGTDRFVASSGTPFSGAVAGDYVSSYADGATTPAFIGQITTVNSSTSIDISLTAISGTRPTTGASGRTATLGGAWLGPTGTVGHPFGFIRAACTAAGSPPSPPRVNFKNGTNYAFTAAITHNFAGPVVFQGYTSSPGDGGQATFDGGAGSGFVMISNNQSHMVLEDLIFQNNGGSGSSNGVSITGAHTTIRRCVFNNIRGNGLSATPSDILIEECEFYACSKNNGASTGGADISGSGFATFLRCIFHDNTGSNVSGLGIGNTGGAAIINCIFDTNQLDGIRNRSTNASVYVIGCDFYNQSGAGINCTATDMAGYLYVENCNFIKNGTYGVFTAGSSAGHTGRLMNCGYGSGTQANGTADTGGLGSIIESGAVTYASDVTPYNAPTTGDFRITIAAAIGTGRGTFTETQASYTGTVGYPDIGAAQALVSSGGGLRLAGAGGLAS